MGPPPPPTDLEQNIRLMLSYDANSDGKVTRDELRATTSPTSVTNSVWNGTTVNVFGAKNEIISFNLVLEAATTSVSGRSRKSSFTAG